MQKTDEQAERELEARVNARAEELASLSTHLLQTMEGERAVLAKRLHDELGGLITAAKMDMQWLSAHLGGSLDASGSEKFQSVLQMLDQAMTLKRRVVEELRPSLLEHFGLSVALRSHFEERCGRAGIECVATLPEEIPQLDSNVQLTLFRVAQDALAGILARGGARHVEVVIEPHRDGLGDGYLLTIGDDGSAMDTNLSRSMPSSRHRVALAGGCINAETRAAAQSGPGGNQLRVFVPRSTAVSA